MKRVWICEIYSELITNTATLSTSWYQVKHKPWANPLWSAYLSRRGCINSASCVLLATTVNFLQALTGQYGSPSIYISLCCIRIVFKPCRRKSQFVSPPPPYFLLPEASDDRMRVPFSTRKSRGERTEQNRRRQNRTWKDEERVFA